MDLNAKVKWRDEVVANLDKSGALFLAQYSSMTVEELSQLRRDLRAANAEFAVVKNTVARKAVEGRAEAALASHFTGMTGIVFAYGDVAAAAKAVSEYAKKNEKLKLTAGFMENQLMTPATIGHLASLPSKEVLISKIIGSMVAPHRGLLGVLQGVPRAVVSVLNQIKEQKAG